MSDAVSIPLIGVTTYRQDATWRGGGPVSGDVLSSDYAQSVEAAGGAVVLLPPVLSVEHARVIAERLDGLIIAGGADVNPARYGQEPHPEVTEWRDDRDASELAFIQAADDLGLPILGICRGMQLLAVSRGGSLVQHLPDLIGNDSHTGDETITDRVGFSSVDVVVDAGHRLSSLVPAAVQVNCFHHQIVLEHPGFVATAHSLDGVLHAMEEPGARFVVGVQWHPESMHDKHIFGGLLSAARVRLALTVLEEVGLLPQPHAAPLSPVAVDTIV